MWPWITSQTGRDTSFAASPAFSGSWSSRCWSDDPWTPSNKGCQRGEGRRVPTKVVTERRGQLVQFICKQEVAALQARPNRSWSDGSGGGKHPGSGAARCPVRRESGRLCGERRPTCASDSTPRATMCVFPLFTREREREVQKYKKSEREDEGGVEDGVHVLGNVWLHADSM